MKSVAVWVDVTDGHLYGFGDPFPHDGRKIPDERIDELSSMDNMCGYPVIEVTDEQKPVEKAEQPKKGVKTPKNDT